MKVETAGSAANLFRNVFRSSRINGSDVMIVCGSTGAGIKSLQRAVGNDGGSENGRLEENPHDTILKRPRLGLAKTP